MWPILREADRDPIVAAVKRHGVSEQTIYTWRKRFGTFQATMAENARPKKLVGFNDTFCDECLSLEWSRSRGPRPRS